jgi:hypothetical protein
VSDPFTLITDPRLVQNATIRRGLEGPQLVVEWEAPIEPPLGGLVRVVRKLYEYATNADDPASKVVFEGDISAGYVADIDLEACSCYYYTIFTFDPLTGQWIYSTGTQVSLLAIETGYFTYRLFSLLPEMYVQGDKLLDSDNPDESKFPLFPIFDTVSHEWFNIHENPEDPANVAGVLMGEVKSRGPLSRFLKNIAIELDIVKGLIDCMPNLWDVDEACCDVLPAMGELIGLPVNREFPCTKQREEIRQHVAIIKLKGTAQAIVARARLISGLRVEIQEWCKNILISNRLDRTSLRFPNSEITTHYRRCGDDTDFTPGQEITFQSFTICFYLECDSCLSQQIVEKLARVLPAEYPVCRSGYFHFEDCRFEEEVLPPIENWWDVVETTASRVNVARVNTGRVS